MNFLILAAGTRNKVVQYFKKAFDGIGVVVATDANEYAPAIYDADKHYIVPPITASGYIDVILDICKKENIAGVLSLIDPELSLLAENEERLKEVGTMVIGSSYELCEMSLDKMEMYEWLKGHGYHCARSWKDKEEFYKAVEEGQATYHYDLDPYWDLFKVKELDKAPKWDGHTPEEAIRRIATLSDVPAFKYGQLLVSNQETEIERAITGEKVKVPAGNRVVVGFDQLAHHLWDGSIQPFSKHIMIGGYSNTGIVAAIWERICAEFPVSEMLDEFEIQPKDVTDTIKNALEEIGLYE